MKDYNFRLVDAGNTHNPSLIVLKELGYELGLDPASGSEELLGSWNAKNIEGRIFEAKDTLFLLGTVAIFENGGEVWNKKTNEDIFQSILEKEYSDKKAVSLYKSADSLGNYNNALYVLTKLDYEIGIIDDYEDDEPEGMGGFYAFKDKRLFEACDPLSLLGLVSIWINRGDEWSKEDDEDLYQKIIGEAYPDE